MKKTLFSLMAAAGLIASGAALADTSLVEVYGHFNVDLENVKAKSAGDAVVTPGIGQIGTPGAGRAAPSRNRVTSNSGYIGFKGNEDLGEGFKAIFQLESGVAFDGGTAAPAGSAVSSGLLATRNSHVGLSSKKFGTVFYGIWDTPFKIARTLTDAFYATGIAAGNAIIGTPGFAVTTSNSSVRAVATADASFDRTQGNSVQYWSPTIAGFSGRLMYSANEGRAAEPPAATVPNISPTMYGMFLMYEYGPFRAIYSFEQHRDYFGLTGMGTTVVTVPVAGGVPVAGALVSLTNSTSRDNGNKVTLSYKLFDTTTAHVIWERLSYNNSDTVAGNLIHYQRDAYYFSLLHKIGAGTIRLGFGDARQGSCRRAGATACSTTGLDARHYAVGYSYSLSKRTDLYALYTQVNNGRFATYPLGTGGSIGLAAGASGGARNQGFGLGIRHVF